MKTKVWVVLRLCEKSVYSHLFQFSNMFVSHCLGRGGRAGGGSSRRCEYDVSTEGRLCMYYVHTMVYQGLLGLLEMGCTDVNTHTHNNTHKMYLFHIPEK